MVRAGMAAGSDSSARWARPFPNHFPRLSRLTRCCQYGAAAR